MKHIQILQTCLNELDAYFSKISVPLLIDGILGQKTITKLSFIENKIKSIIIHEKKMLWLESNLIIIRTNSKTWNSKYNDYLCFVQKGKITQIVHCSSLAGLYYVQNPISWGGITGTAIIAEQQKQAAFKAQKTNRLGFKRNDIELVQNQPFLVYRDSKIDSNIDKLNLKNVLVYCNIHSSGFGYYIDNWSAGCVVIPRSEFLEAFEPLLLENELYNLTLIEI